VPLNLRIGSFELPVGLALITAALFAIAIVNLFTKQLATIWGLTFTAILYVVFIVSERHNTRRRLAAHGEAGLDQFQLLPATDLGLADVAARPGSVLVPVRDYNTLAHLNWALNHVDTGRHDVVAMTVRLIQGPDAAAGRMHEAEIFTDYEQLLFTRVVAVAERQGRPVKLLVVPSSNVFDAVAQTAVRLSSSEIVLGDSAKFSAADQARLLGEAWERVENSDKLRTRLLAYKLNGEVQSYLLGPHAPTLSSDDLDLIHRLWLEAVADVGIEVHHRDVVRVALEKLRREIEGAKRHEAMDLIRRQAKAPAQGDAVLDQPPERADTPSPIGGGPSASPGAHLG
jgi:hypothetical protein